MKNTCLTYVKSVCSTHPELSKKQKTHLLLHLVDDMVNFGPALGFCTERYCSKLYVEGFVYLLMHAVIGIALKHVNILAIYYKSTDVSPSSRSFASKT
jgi:hypothetical protein